MKEEYIIWSFHDGFNQYTRYSKGFTVNLKKFYTEEEMLLLNPVVWIKSVLRNKDNALFEIGEEVSFWWNGNLHYETIDKIHKGPTTMHADTTKFKNLPLNIINRDDDLSKVLRIIEKELKEAEEIRLLLNS
jgi:hypothetical protein